ncbi:MAG: hypothetical protein HY868_06425 [Chloroflexi bacterium]|nr:hypothetical protein [Chloroflexota bacterium]
MADPLPKYRFLPWTRRGLAAAIPQLDTGANLPARAPLPVAITVTNVAPTGVNLELYGPGDVIGVDPRLIVRTDPRPNITDFEPNYLAAIEFDLPDFPWMFTPARAGSHDHLRPWCVLVVLDQRVVTPPKVNRGAPLPVVIIPAEASASELPNLAESWAWAHVQVMSDNTDANTLQQEMTSQPNLNVARLVCPRRLEPNHRYLACLVPAFDLGVQRGLGLTPNGTTIKPAWDSANPGEVKLPLYFHWEFATGPAGDFESLARKLTPVKASGEIGFQRMFVGAPGGGLPTTPASDEASYLKMEGVLRAPKVSNSSLDDVAAAMRAGLRQAINAPGEMLRGANPSRIAISPPIYGEWHLNRHAVQDAPGNPEWLRALNLDPRARAAAGLGGEVVRANQEDFMQVAWEQVGDVIKANELLNRARFALDVHRRTYERHYVTLPQDRLLQMTGALHARTLMADKTVRAQITLTSLPNASVDPALRRLASPQRAWLKSIARRGNFASGGSRSVRSMLIPALVANKVTIDPDQFTPDSIVGAAILDELAAKPGATQVDLAPFGIQARLDVNNLNRMKAARATLLKIKPQNIPKIVLRPNLPSSGVIVKSQLDKLRALQAQLLSESIADPQRERVRFNVPAILSELSNQVKQNEDAPVFLVNAEPDARALVSALRVDARGNVLLRGALVANLGSDLRARKRAALTQLLSDLPTGALPSKRVARAVPLTLTIPTKPPTPVPTPIPPPSRPPTIPPKPPIPEPVPTLPPTVILPPPTKDRTVISRFKQAFATMSKTVRLDTPDPLPRFVAFGVKTARDTLVARLDPDVMVLRRVQTMIGGEAGLALESIIGVKVLPTFDRVMVAPEIAAPMYSYLAKYDRERFLPGIGQLPPDSITLLETNPRFIEAFMVGLNYEMNRELLWREYPTDQRGTPLRKFWSWSDGGADLPQPIHQWITGGLGAHVRGTGQGGQIVLLLRGQLLRRYPNTIIYAWRTKNKKLKDPPAAGDILEPVFRGTFDPDVSFAGFDLRDTDLTDGEGWFFVLQEQPTEPRLGFDETRTDPLDNWSNASWDDVGVESGKYIKIQGSPLNNLVLGGVMFGKNSAHLAHITLQKPMRVAIHGKHMVDI